MKGIINDKVFIKTEGIGYKEKFLFSRNSLGFRNNEFDASKIDGIFMGGSTAVEKSLKYEDTIVGILNNKFKNKKIIIANAGQQGKSVYGYLCDFKYWFPKIKNLKPKYYIFYTGINEVNKFKNSEFLNCTLSTSKMGTLEKIYDYILISSLYLSNIRKIRLKYGLGTGLIVFKYQLDNEVLYKSYQEVDEIYHGTENFNNTLTIKQIKVLDNYKSNLEKLKVIFDERKIKPIFITQIRREGISNSLYLINRQTKIFAQKNDYILIKLDEELVLNSRDFIDGPHTNQKGSKKVADFIYNKVKKYFLDIEDNKIN